MEEQSRYFGILRNEVYLSSFVGPPHLFHPDPASKNSLSPCWVEFFSHVSVPLKTACSLLLDHAQAYDNKFHAIEKYEF